MHAAPHRRRSFLDRLICCLHAAELDLVCAQVGVPIKQRTPSDVNKRAAVIKACEDPDLRKKLVKEVEFILFQGDPL